MRIKRFTLMLIIMIAILIVKPSFAAEVLKITQNLTVTSFTQTYDKYPYDSNGVVSHWNKATSSYSFEPYRRSGRIDLSIDLPVPLEIDSERVNEILFEGLTQAPWAMDMTPPSTSATRITTPTVTTPRFNGFVLNLDIAFCLPFS